MTVSSVNGVNQVKSSPVGKAAIAASVAGGATLLSKVGYGVYSNKVFIKNPQKVEGLALSISLLKDQETFGFLKDVISDMKLPKSLKNWYLKSADPSGKKYKESLKVLEEVSNSVKTGKVDLKPILKRSLKSAGVTAAVVGGVVLAGSLIAKAINAKKASAEKAE